MAQVHVVKNIALALLGINVIIAIHESGHFLFCKFFNIETPIFAIGFGPTKASITPVNTTFALNTFPLGGYVSIKGMASDDPSPNSFETRPYYQKALVILSGVLFNFIYGFGTLAFLDLRVAARRFRQLLKDLEYKRSFIGPIGIARIMYKSAERGFGLFQFFLATLSINLGFFNLLPLPFLDGGHLLTYTLREFATEENIFQQALIITALFLLLMYIFYALLSRSRTIYKETSQENSNDE